MNFILLMFSNQATFNDIHTLTVSVRRLSEDGSVYVLLCYDVTLVGCITRLIESVWAKSIGHNNTLKSNQQHEIKTRSTRYRRRR